MANAQSNGQFTEQLQKTLLYHFCRVRLPQLNLSFADFERHLSRCFDLYHDKQERKGETVTWSEFLEDLHTVDWFLCCACLERSEQAWDTLFASRANRTDCLLIDALRARAVRLFPADEGRQESSVHDFWGYLLAGETEGSLPILARYDGQRPLVPWLIRVFQNRVISKEFRSNNQEKQLHEDEIEARDLPLPINNDGRWNEEFREAASEWLASLKEEDLLLLGLRFRYQLSQRDVAKLIGINEGNVSRKLTKISTGFTETLRDAMQQAGWPDEDLDQFIRQEMAGVLTEEVRLSADHLAALLAARGKSLDEVTMDQ